MASLSRRHFLGTTAGSALAAAVVPVSTAIGAVQPAARLRVQFATGGHTSPLQMYAMFESALFQDMDTVVLPHPDPFDRVGTPDAPHVIVTNDWITGQWPKKDQDNMQRHIEGGGGVVVLHHAVGSNNGTATVPGWKWWNEEVLGCYLYNPNVPGVKTSARLKQFPIQTITPGRQPSDRPGRGAVPAAVGRDLSQHVDLAEVHRAVHVRRPVVQQPGGRLGRAAAAAWPLRVPAARTHRDRLPGSDLPADRPQRDPVGRREAVMIQAPPPQGPPNQSPRFAKTELWVQLTTGGKAVPAVVAGDVPRPDVRRHGDLADRPAGQLQRAAAAVTARGGTRARSAATGPCRGPDRSHATGRTRSWRRRARRRHRTPRARRLSVGTERRPSASRLRRARAQRPDELAREPAHRRTAGARGRPRAGRAASRAGRQPGLAVVV